MAKSNSDQRKANGSDRVENGHSFAIQLANYDPALLDQSTEETEARAAKRLQKNTPKSTPLARPAEPTPSAAMRLDQKTTFATRRRQSSFRDQRAIPPNLFQGSPSKRSSHDDPPRMNQQVSGASIPRAHGRQPSVNTSPKYGHASDMSSNKSRISQSSGSFDFLPSVNFDDFHASLTSDGSLIDAFPAPGGSSDRFATVTNSKSMASRPPLKDSKTADSSELPSRLGLNGTSFRRHNSISQSNGDVVTNGEVKTTGYTPTAATRARRKSYFTTPDNNINASRAPRKSVGPGIISSDFNSHNPQQAALHNRPVIEGRRSESNDTNPSVRRPNVLENSRHQKAKSFHSPRRGTDQPSTPNETQGALELFGSTGSKSPGRSNRTNTPSSSKRLSMMPNSAHATGLAARTISPTDARRMKRMSMMPSVPPLPNTPPTPQAESLPPAILPPNPSPSMIPRKSVTPSSTRTTPEPNRKSYSSGISTSSTTSYNSFLASSGPTRISQSFSASRLPTLKIRGENATITDEEVVPPVPAIPKAYESPKGELEHTFFSSRKASFPFDASSLGSSSSFGGASHMEVDTQKIDPEIISKRAVNDADRHGERKPSAGTANRRTLQPLRLPPLNLLPLSTPTTTKIAALSVGATSSAKSGSVTPPPKKGAKGTPTTPMTASKALTSKTILSEEARPIPSQIRSSSSHHTVRPDPVTYRAPSTSSTQATTPVERYATPASRAAMSPFISTSLPKSSGEFGPLRREMSHPVESSTETRTNKPTGPRLQKPKKFVKDDESSLDTPSSVDNNQSLGSSLRRKLSLSRRRSSSKTQTSAERDNEVPPNPPKHNDMPPPRLPASATWSGPLLTSPSPTQKSSQSRNTRNVSNSSNFTPNDRHRSHTWDTVDTPRKGSAQETKQRRTPVGEIKRTARSILEGTSNKNTLSLKDFLQEARKMDVMMDSDDLSAEEEMKKLASKRKETENAAKEVDALQRRATPKERRSPALALQMDRQKSRRRLNTFEVGEIVDYRDIYFVGNDNVLKHKGNLENEAGNFGYDDERGDYNIVNGDHLAYRYEVVDILGKGSFGQVVRCIDHKTGGLVAVKIIRNKKRFHQQALVEVDILKKLRNWDPHNKHSMVNFTQSFYFRGHLCISTELLGMNLYEFIKCHDFRGFSLKLIRRFAKQLLSSLVLLKGHNVIHCDLKPENILLAHPARAEIKVIDFGSSCLENEKVYTYIQSRFYRSPEVILGMTYGIPIDMWSMGCILAELLTGYPIFPGEDEREQLACIMEVFGPPEKHLIEKSTRKKLFFDSLGKPRITVSSKGKRRRPSSKTLQQALKCEDEAFLDFISRCLRWDPDRRLKPDEAVHHEFITGKSAKAAANRPRTAPSNPSASPLKRYNSLSQTPSSTSRPLPEPPTTSFKTSSALRNGTSNTSSPSKSVTTSSTGKRYSNVNGLQNTNSTVIVGGVKRAVNGSAVQGSALPRVANPTRVASGMVTGGPLKGASGVDLATAAATASLKSR